MAEKTGDRSGLGNGFSVHFVFSSELLAGLPDGQTRTRRLRFFRTVTVAVNRAIDGLHGAVRGRRTVGDASGLLAVRTVHVGGVPVIPSCGGCIRFASASAAVPHPNSAASRSKRARRVSTGWATSIL